MGHFDSIARATIAQHVVLWLTVATSCVAMPGCEACDSCERATRQESHREPDERVVLPGGGILVKERPIIPEHLRANCHVCPEWCTQVDLRPLPVGTVIAEYRRHAAIYAGTTRAWHRLDGWGRLEQLGCIVAGGGPLLGRRFAELLRDPDPAIRFPVAVHTLQYDIDKAAALATLRTMAGREQDDRTSDGPDGPDYANRAYLVLTEYGIGNPVELP